MARDLGTLFLFLLPSLKLKQRDDSGSTQEERLHRHLLANFGGYTAAAGNIFGFWRNDGRDVYGEHREYRVALPDDDRRKRLESFLSDLAREMSEEEIYCEAAGRAFVLSASK